jgi:hypothetical protein
MEEMTPYMEGSYEYIKYSHRQLTRSCPPAWGWVRGWKLLTIRKQLVTKC